MMKERTSERIEMLSTSGEGAISLFDLSKGGVCCYHDSKKEKGEFATVKIKDLSLRAKVIYCQERTDGFRLGLQFWDVPSSKQEKLDFLVEKFSRGVPLNCRVEDDASSKKE